MPVWFAHAVLADARRVHRQILQCGPELQARQACRSDRDPHRRALRFDRELVRVVERRGRRHHCVTGARGQPAVQAEVFRPLAAECQDELGRLVVDVLDVMQ
jgi:hypothetical protein